MAKEGASWKITKKIQTATVQNAYTANKTVASGATASSATAFSVAGWEGAKLETLIETVSAAADVKGNVVFNFFASLDGTNYDGSSVTATQTSNAWKAITMVCSNNSGTLRRITSCHVAGLASIKLVRAVHAASGGIKVNARLVKAR